MRCPFCGQLEDRVIDSREAKEGLVTRRRRQCLSCGRRYTTYETIDEIPYMVIKKSGRRERFERKKVLDGILRACKKRPVSMKRMEEVVDEIEREVVDRGDREISSDWIGRHVMKTLLQLDPVAYLRFASVYMEFEDVAEFTREIERFGR